MHQITCESSPIGKRWSPKCIKLPVNRHQDWNEVALSPNMSFDLFSMSLDLFSMSLDPRVKTILGDLCFIGPVQHVIGPVQHVIRPVQHFI
ncbi:hypothetical protein TNCV_1994871 [Trichonephila clavipes]|uniref:Uncharacterized protein n=1 Tax=Trichonephila clavipes TaxID=2585209 RepID=A0A8X6RA50_TRICX|nr:hypothetical protein TNCV_1994871 [Trichonephila clavipes]